MFVSSLRCSHSHARCVSCSPQTPVTYVPSPSSPTLTPCVCSACCRPKSKRHLLRKTPGAAWRLKQSWPVVAVSRWPPLTAVMAVRQRRQRAAPAHLLAPVRLKGVPAGNIQQGCRPRCQGRRLLRRARPRAVVMQPKRTKGRAAQEVCFDYHAEGQVLKQRWQSCMSNSKCVQGAG